MGDRYGDVRPLTKGRIGHPADDGRKMHDCVGVSFVDRATRDIWSYRIYPAKLVNPAGRGGAPWSYPEIAVVTHSVARAIRSGKSAGHLNMVVVPDVDVPPAILTFAKAELVKLRLLGKIKA